MKFHVHRKFMGMKFHCVNCECRLDSQESIPVYGKCELIEKEIPCIIWYHRIHGDKELCGHGEIDHGVRELCFLNGKHKSITDDNDLLVKNEKAKSMYRPVLCEYTSSKNFTETGHSSIMHHFEK